MAANVAASNSSSININILATLDGNDAARLPRFQRCGGMDVNARLFGCCRYQPCGEVYAAKYGEIFGNTRLAFKIDPLVRLYGEVRIIAIKVNVATDNGVVVAGDHHSTIILQRGNSSCQQISIASLTKQFMRFLYLNLINSTFIITIKRINNVFIGAIGNNPAIGIDRFGASPIH